MKKRNIILTALSVALAVSASAFTVFGGFKKASPNVQATENDNAYWEQYFDVESEGDVTFNSTADLPSYMNNVSYQLTDFTNKTVETGLGVTFNSKTTITYKNPVLASSLDRDMVLFEYLPIPTVQSVKKSGVASDPSDSEFSNVLIRLENAENENEFVEIQHFRSSHDVSLSWVRTRSSTTEFAGLKKAVMDPVVDKGTPIRANFTGLATSASEFYVTKSTSFRASGFYFDNSTSTVYAAHPLYDELSYGAETGTVRSYLKPAHLLGADEIFAGFTSEFVKVSITFDKLYVEGNDAHVLLTKVLGQPLQAPTFEDVNAPVISLPKECVNVPNGEKDTYYPFWDIKGYDVIEGSITNKLSYKVEYTGLTNADAPVAIEHDGSGFVPTKTGYYNVTVSLEDSSGNKAKDEIVNIRVLPIVETIALEFANGATLPIEASVGEKITIPEYSLTGGSGELKVDFSVSYNNRTVDIDVINNTFFVNYAGVYNVTFVISDYLGDYRVFDYAITSKLSDKPIIEDVILPKYYKKGSPIRLNMPKAYDFASFPGLKTEVPVVMEASDTNEEGSYVQVNANETGAYVYTPSQDADNIYVRFKAKTVIGAKEVIKNVEVIKLYDVEHPVEFWHYDDSKIERLYDKFGRDSLTKEYYYQIKEEGAELDYLIPLQSETFSIGLNFLENASYFEKITITLRDSENVNEVVTFTITKRNEETVFVATPSINYANTTGQIYDVKGVSNVYFRFKLGKQLVDNMGSLILNLSEFDDGTVFDGFSSGRVFVNVKFNEMLTGDGIVNYVKLGQFYSQFTYDENSSDADGPFITTEYHINTYYNYLEEVTLPAANAYDMYSPYCDTYLVVKDPDGKIIIDNAPADREYKLLLNKNGRYSVEYNSTDEYDNYREISYNLFTLDVVDPIIEINGQIKTQVKVGEILVLPDYYVTDNYNAPEDILKYVYLETPTFGYKTIAIGDVEGTYKFQVAGEYTLVYFAMDKSSNYAYKTFTITVTN